MTEWRYRIGVIVPIGDYESKNALWTIIAPEGDPEAHTFGVPLSPTGLEPATHSGMSTAATEEMRILIQEIFPDGLTVSVQSYAENDWDDFLAANGLMEVG